MRRVLCVYSLNNRWRVVDEDLNTGFGSADYLDCTIELRECSVALRRPHAGI